MKKIFLTFMITLCVAYISSYAQQDSQPGISYTIDFVFTGQVQNQADSVFALQYTFSKADFAKFSKLHLEDSQKSYTIYADNAMRSDTLETASDTLHVFLRFRKYDKYDIPILMHSEDKAGKATPLYLQYRSGKRVSGADFKNQVKAIRESVRKQNRQNDSNQ